MKFDTAFIRYLEPNCFNCERYYGIYDIDFKETLSDGTWVFYDSSIYKNPEIKKLIRMKGEFKDSLREGVFSYYETKGYGKNAKNRLDYFVTYKNGLLDGPFCYFRGSAKCFEGYFSKNKKDGFFIEYDCLSHDTSQGKIEKIENYSGGVLGDWAVFSYLGKLIVKGNGDSKNLTGDYLKYSSEGKLDYKGQFINGKLINYKEYKKDTIIYLSGEFEKISIRKNSSVNFKETILKNGKITYIGSHGEILKSEEVIDGKVN